MSEPEQPEHVYRRTSKTGNFIRGALIGTVETVPGVSGGTVALVVGIYHQIIDSAGSVISGVRALITGPDRVAGFKEEFAKAHWNVIIPVVIGMALAVFTVAGPMATLMEKYPVPTKSLFFGMVLCSVAVPVRMLLRDLEFRRNIAEIKGQDASDLRVKPWHVLLSVVAAVLIFFLVSLQPAEAEVSPWVVIPAAAVAVSALVLPGLSGSFLLLTFGLYEPTMRAVSNFDFGYLSLFAVGLVIGMIVVVKLLQWLLQNHHTVTLAVLTGVMVGGLRALWPWQDDERNLSAPGADVWTSAGLAILGFAVVMLLVGVDAKATRKQDKEVLQTMARAAN